MENEPILSLCIPTNGVLEWVEPVLESIYDGINDLSKFEVIVTDNGNNELFEKAMCDYSETHYNFGYYRTDAYMFLNQIEAFKLAKGQLIKFVNHRSLLLPGTVEYLISYAVNNNVNKPVTFFANGALNVKKDRNICSTFNDFVNMLSYWSSWSGGTAMWKSDFDRMNIDADFNILFPHIDLVFSNKKAKEYVIENRPIMCDIPVDVTKKGKYDLFGAFAVEYPRIIENLLREKYITQETFEKVVRENGSFVNQLYFDYVVRGLPCSYDLSGFESSVGAYYTKTEICGNRMKNYIRAYTGLLITKVKNVCQK